MRQSKSVISVTGTNGKGSVIALCEAILLAAGYKVGAYYSPHVFDIGERIKINNIFYYLDSPVIPFDFRQFTQGAIDLFNQQHLDVVLLEVGIGARLDPVNLLIEPDISVITNVDLDHQDKLGDSLDSIGFEKAHLYRPHKPAIFGAENIPKTVVNYAEKIQAELLCYKKDFKYEIYDDHWEFINHNVTYENLPLPILTLHDAAIALETLSHLPVEMSRDAICHGLRTANLPGRFKIMTEPVMQIFDIAHNPAAALQLYNNLEKIPCRGKTYAVVGMLADKDIAGTLHPFKNRVQKWFVGTLDDPRAACAQQIGACLSNSVLFEDIHEAYQCALAEATPHDRLVIFGSSRTVGALCPDKN